MRHALLLTILVAASAPAALAAPEPPYKAVRLDDERRVVVQAPSGQWFVFSGRAMCDDPKLTPDGRTVGYRVLRRIPPSADSIPTTEVAEELRIHAPGRPIRRIVPGGYIRSWRFWSDGRQVALYSGGLHFAGFYVLYDIASGRDLYFASDPVTSRSPGWVRGLAP
ncbi:MAG TPA: hypothetical protein VJY35_04125 [Candidatus Eisenbacteria bacterium]|nr:hypothetical protein [Candidatus Eisenbacteria bacterium]